MRQISTTPLSEVTWTWREEGASNIQQRASKVRATVTSRERNIGTPPWRHTVGLIAQDKQENSAKGNADGERGSDKVCVLGPPGKVAATDVEVEEESPVQGRSVIGQIER